MSRLLALALALKLAVRIKPHARRTRAVFLMAIRPAFRPLALIGRCAATRYRKITRKFPNKFELTGLNFKLRRLFSTSR
jgi:hypothetical protein